MKTQLTGKDSDAEKHWEQEEKRAREDKMVGWHHWLNGHEFEQTLGNSEEQRSLVCYSPWDRRVRHNLVTEQQPPVGNFLHFGLCFLTCEMGLIVLSLWCIWELNKTTQVYCIRCCLAHGYCLINVSYDDIYVIFFLLILIVLVVADKKQLQFVGLY